MLLENLILNGRSLKQPTVLTSSKEKVNAFHWLELLSALDI